MSSRARRRVLVWLGLFAAIVVLVAGSVRVLELAFPKLEVIYEVGGTSNRAELSLTTPTSLTWPQHTQPLPNVRLPARYVFRFERGDHLFVEVHNDGPGTVTCRIVLAGRTVAQQTASGAGAIATCSVIA